MFDFFKKLPYEDFKPGAFEGFLLSCPEEARRHILLCVKCQESLDPLFQVMYESLLADKILDQVKKINKDIVNHIKEKRKLNRNV